MNEGLEKYQIAGVVISTLLLLAVNYFAYCLSLKSICEEFPNKLKSVIIYSLELFAWLCVGLVAYVLSRVAISNHSFLPDEMTFALFVVVISTLIALILIKKYSIGYLMDASVGIFHAITLLVMHFFYAVLLLWIFTYSVLWIAEAAFGYLLRSNTATLY